MPDEDTNDNIIGESDEVVDEHLKRIKEEASYGTPVDPTPPPDNASNSGNGPDYKPLFTITNEQWSKLAFAATLVILGVGIGLVISGQKPVEG